MPNVAKTYPLPEEEKSALLKQVLVSDGVLAFFGIVFATAAMSVKTGDWTVSFFGSTWLPLTDAAYDPNWLMIILPLALALVFGIADVVMSKRFPEYRQDVLDIRQGINGELPRLGPVRMVVLCAYAGATEEIAFRYGLLGFFIAVSQALVPGVLSLAAAILLQAGIFAFMHDQYGRVWELAIVLTVGIAFGIVYVITQNLLVVMVAHALYDFIDLLIERYRMMKEPDYFDGNVPNDLVSGSQNK